MQFPKEEVGDDKKKTLTTILMTLAVKAREGLLIPLFL